MQQQSYLLVTNEAVWVTGFFLTKFALGCMSYSREENVFFRPCILGKKLFREYVIINDRHVNFSDLSPIAFLFLPPITPCAKGCLNFERIYFVTFGCVQTDACCVRVGSGLHTNATTPNNVGTCSASWNDTTHKSL